MLTSIQSAKTFQAPWILKKIVGTLFLVAPFYLAPRLRSTDGVIISFALLVLVLSARPLRVIVTGDSMTYRPPIGPTKTYEFSAIVSITPVRRKGGRAGPEVWAASIQLYYPMWKPDVVSLDFPDEGNEAIDCILQAWYRYADAHPIEPRLKALG